MSKYAHLYKQAAFWYQLITIAFVLLSIEQIWNVTYIFIWTFNKLGIGPDYATWIQYTLINIVIITLLFVKKVRFLGLIGIILYCVSGLVFLYNLHGLNPTVWFHNGNPTQGIFIFIWIGEIILALMGIYLWWKLRKTQNHTMPR